MPASSADTFWGKGFLATALGTASPDRKKTHKGQTRLASSSCCEHLGIYRKKQRRSAHLMHARTFLKQGGRRQDTVRRAFPNSLDIDTATHVTILSPLLPPSTSSPPSRKLELCFLWNVIHPINSHRVSDVPFTRHLSAFSLEMHKNEHRFTKYYVTSQGKHPLNGIKWKVTKLDAVLVSKVRPALIQVKYYLYQTETRCFKIIISSSGIIFGCYVTKWQHIKTLFNLVFWEVFQTSNILNRKY